MKKIAVVEDDPKAQAIYAQALVNAGYEVVTFSDAKTALVELPIQKPDLILLDIMLPGGLNGFDIVEQLKRDDTTKNTPIIFLSNLDSEKKVAAELGVGDYLVKAQTSLEQIVTLVHKYLD